MILLVILNLKYGFLVALQIYNYFEYFDCIKYVKLCSICYAFVNQLTGVAWAVG